MSLSAFHYLFAVCLFLFPFFIHGQELDTRTPNIIIVLPDDLGYGDYACLGNPISRTPSVDAFKKESLLLTQFHVSPTCSPTRAALMSGRHEFKNGVTHTIHERERMNLATYTLPQMLKSVGYTTGIFGKWHLGDEEAYRPENRGFDEVFIHGGGGIGQTFQGSCGDVPQNRYMAPTIWHNGKFEKTEGYCTDEFFAQSIRWMDAVRRTKKPFFSYIATNVAHAPLQVPNDDYKQYLGKPGVNEDVAKFYWMLENVDSNFGKLLGKLKEWGITENTLVIYIGTDNGGTKGIKIFNAGMQGGKGSTYQGGTRAPCFVRWPAAGVPAGVECDALSAHLDLFPTLAEITGATLTDEVKKQVEGRSLLPLFKNPKAEWADRTLVHNGGRWNPGESTDKARKEGSIQNSRFSLIISNKGLYEFRTDPGEVTDVSAKYPDIVANLSAAYDAWWAAIPPFLVNEEAYLHAPKMNPMKELYWKQFGGGPNEKKDKSEKEKKTEGEPLPVTEG